MLYPFNEIVNDIRRKVVCKKTAGLCRAVTRDIYTYEEWELAATATMDHEG